jgi:hypothetical protein
MASARRAYGPWLRNLNHLWRRYDVPSPLDGVLPDDFRDWHDMCGGFAGTPEQAREYVGAQMEEAEANYLCADVCFGDLTFDEVVRTVELFGREIIPALAEPAGRA